jgi:hypothetical protein
LRKHVRCLAIRRLDSEHRLALDERRQELVAEREQVAEQMAQIEERLVS